MIALGGIRPKVSRIGQLAYYLLVLIRLGLSLTSYDITVAVYLSYVLEAGHFRCRASFGPKRKWFRGLRSLIRVGRMLMEDGCLLEYGGGGPYYGQWD